MIHVTHNEAVIALYSGFGAVTMFLGWWMRGPRAKSLDRAWDEGYGVGRDGEVMPGDALRARGPGQDAEGAPPSSITGPGRTNPDCLSDEFHERYCAPGRTIYPELAALGAESHAEPPEPISARLDETTEQWAARMRAKAAIWCAENGIDLEMEPL